jgi:hypothetical protein
VIYGDQYESLCARDADELRLLDMSQLQRDRLERHLAASDDAELESCARVAGAAWLAGQP